MNPKAQDKNSFVSNQNETELLNGPLFLKILYHKNQIHLFFQKKMKDNVKWR